ncbi:MAG: hypothetical protein ACKO66_08470, partial [Flavobacteriales bacterium]
LVYSANGCSDSIMVTVFPSGLPDTPLTFCSTDNPVELVPGLPDGGYWSGTGVLDPSSGIFSPAQATPGTNYIYWTTQGGCQDSIQVTVEEFLVPTISGIASAYCYSDLNVNFSVSPAGGILVGSLASNQFNVQDLGPGNYDVTYLYTPQICEPSSANVSFEVYPPLDLQPLVVSANPVCPTQPLTITASVSGGDPGSSIEYAWSNGSPSQAAITFVPGVSQNISLTVSDGCSDNQTEDVDLAVFSAFTIEITTSDTLCDGEMGSVSLSLFPGGNYAVEWNGQNGPASLFEVSAGDQVEIVVTDENGCEQDTFAIAPVFPPVGALFSVSQGEDCLPADQMGNVGFVDESVNAMNGIWDFGDG